MEKPKWHLVRLTWYRFAAVLSVYDWVNGEEFKPQNAWFEVVTAIKMAKLSSASHHLWKKKNLHSSIKALMFCSFEQKKNSVKLSHQKKKVECGCVPMPIYTAINSRRDISADAFAGQFFCVICRRILLYTAWLVLIVAKWRESLPITNMWKFDFRHSFDLISNLHNKKGTCDMIMMMKIALITNIII